MKTVKSVPPVTISPKESKTSHRLADSTPMVIRRGRSIPTVIIAALMIRSNLGRKISRTGTRTGSIRVRGKVLVAEAIAHLLCSLLKVLSLKLLYKPCKRVTPARWIGFQLYSGRIFPAKKN
jgi:hypothetical protein